MSILKKKYYLFIENTREFNLNLIKKRDKFNIIYRNQNNKEKFKNLFVFRKKCKELGIKFFISNDTKLLIKLNADGLYISAHNKKLLLNRYNNIGYKIIGSAHNQKEITIKMKQGCEVIVLSRLFKTTYKEKTGYLGLLRFNNIALKSGIELVPLGGINQENLKKMETVNCNSIACLSAIKKKPAKFINRLF